MNLSYEIYQIKINTVKLVKCGLELTWTPTHQRTKSHMCESHGLSLIHLSLSYVNILPAAAQ